MDRLDGIMVSGLGVFIGALLLSAFVGGGIEADDINGAAALAVIVALSYGWLTRNKAK